MPTELSLKEQERSLTLILEEGLAVNHSDEVLLIYDESFLPYLEAFVKSLGRKDLVPTCLFLPHASQMKLADTISRHQEPIWFPDPLRSAISASSVILNVLDGELHTAPVRGGLLSQQRSRECRLAHIPGFTDDILRIVLETNFGEVLRHCELISWFLGQGGDTIISTYDCNGNEYVLTLTLAGWSNEPLMSPGVISPGSWGNIPPGEAFCCPEPASVNGKICVNGSLPKVKLQGQDVILSFEQGKLIHWKSEVPEAEEFFREQEREAEKYGDPNWGVFAELGIGLNSAVRDLTGNSLFDEKAAETVHIAIGNNVMFGHSVQSRTHADLVTIRPTLEIGGVTIMDRGVLAVSNLQVLREKWVAPGLKLSQKARIRLKDDEIEDRNGLAYRRLYKSGRLGFVSMANEETSSAVAKLYKELQHGNPIVMGILLEDHPEFNEISTEYLIELLVHYGCLDIVD
jgi:hypothetical protein